MTASAIESRSVGLRVAVCLALVAGVGPSGAVAAQDMAPPDACVVELEPNDTAADAQPLALADCSEDTSVRGRASVAESDFYRLEIPDEPATLRDVTLSATADLQLTLCLHDVGGTLRQCHTGPAEASLPDLLLGSGPHLLEVRAGAEGDYELRVESTGPWDPSLEAEPNDSLYDAIVLDLRGGVHGRSHGREDIIAFTVTGPEQLWEVVASGEGIRRLYLLNERRHLATGSIDSSGQRAVLTDVILPPGTHYFLVLADGAYHVGATALGTPAAEAEREPNDDALLATELPIGGWRGGRIAGASDVDVYRFTAAAPEHVVLTLEQPPEADIELHVATAGTELVRQRSIQPGAPIDLDLWLPPGDHEVTVYPVVPSEERYTLALQPADPFIGSVDREPNDRADLAAPVPATLAIEGSRDGRDDIDWYRLPLRPESETVSVTIEPADTQVFLMLDDVNLPMASAADGTLAWDGLPVDAEVYLQVRPAGDYAIRLDIPGLAASVRPRMPDVQMSLALADTTVAAYLPLGQHVGGMLSLTNPGTSALHLSLDAVTSHHAWRARTAQRSLTLGAGEQRTVPIAIAVAEDAWADVPVRVSVAAHAADGGVATTSAELVARIGAAAVTPDHGWTLPPELLGGLDVASLALGAVPLEVPGADLREALHDGVTPANRSFRVPFDGTPIDIAVDLAGDVPVPVAGTILNPVSLTSSLRELPREIELLLSTDGTDWHPVLRTELLPLGQDQAFALDMPMPATHAMLRIHSLHGPPIGQVGLGEWKVVAVPGVEPTSMPRDIADPGRGGHPVVYAPFGLELGPGYRMLDPDLAHERLPRRPAGADFELVVGLRGGRAAQLTGLTWADPEGSDAANRPGLVGVAISLDGPLGPWQQAGTWELARDTSGSVTPFTFEAPRWARFLRLHGELPEDAVELEVPGTIEVLERATGADYRSVLAEWGEGSRLGPYEWSTGKVPATAPLDDTVGDTPAEATALAPGQPVSERATLGEDDDWFVVDIPPDDDTLVVDLAGTPNVEVVLTVLDADGNRVETWSSRVSGGVTRYEAVVVAGGRYHLHVEQPPSSIAFLFDASESMGPYFEIVMRGLREHAAAIEPGRESVLVMPFGGSPLLDDWSDDPYAVQAAVTDYVLFGAAGLSNAEETLIAALARLRERDGRRAVLLITDADSPTEHLTSELWTLLDEVRPLIHALHTNNVVRPFDTRDRMRAWAASSGGHYETPMGQGDMDRAFARLAAWLRRPSDYQLTATTSAMDHPPGRLRVGRPARVSGTTVGPDVGIEILLDTSASMRQRIGGKRRIAVAKASMRTLLTETLAEGVPVAIRTFGTQGRTKAARCGTDLALPLAPLEAAAALRFVRGLAAPRRAATPLAEAIGRVPNDLASVVGTRIVVLITDGDESCGGDVEAAIDALQAAGVAVTLNIVGFALADEQLKERMDGWAHAAGGDYFDAGSAAELASSIETAVSPPFRVYGTTSDAVGQEALVATGTVGGDAVELPAGTYRVDVLIDPLVSFEAVAVPRGEDVTLELPGD